ncbi:MAG: (Fe-S)-binding protein, partial [Christensenellaceae bacterium]
ILQNLWASVFGATGFVTPTDWTALQTEAYTKAATKIAKAQAYADEGVADLKERLESVDIMKLDDDRYVALQKIQQIEELVQKLPGMDCGSCGAPSCRSLAEDIVRGYANEIDCIFLLKERVRYLAEEMVDLASKDKE